LWQWVEHVDRAEIMFPQLKQVVNRERDNIFGSDICQYLTAYLSNNFSLRQSILR